MRRSVDAGDRGGEPERVTRSVVVADLVESVRLMQFDELDVIARWRRFVGEVVAELLPARGGRLVKSLGDGMLLEFADPLSAAEATLELHERLRRGNAGYAPERHFWLRCAVHETEVVVDELDVYGAGVNLAARLARLARPGESVVSTTVRDAIDSGRGVGPRVVVDCLVDGDGKASLGTLRVSSPDDIAPVVELAVKARCAEIKVYSSVKPALVAPLSAEAHRRGLRVTGHVPTGMDLNDALDAGFDGVNHIQYVPSIVFPKKREELEKLSRAERRRRVLDLDLASPPMQQLFRRMAKQKTVYDPTVALFELFLHPASVLAEREPGLAKMPRELRGVFGGGMDPDDVDVNRRVFEKYLAAIREMHKLGVTIVAGTDIGVPGHTLHRELELYVAAGFSPLEALQAATIVPARVLGKDRELGTVTTGKRADLVVVDGNPLADIRALRKVRLVIARGRVYDPATMWKVAGFQP